MKRQIPLMIVIILGFLFVGHTFIPHKYSIDFYDWFISWTKAISPFAVALGVMSLWMVHGTKVTRKAPNWQYSLVTLVALVFTAFAGFMWGTNEGTPFMWLFKNVQLPMSATMFSLLAFYISSAAYKAFRARSPEATVLLAKEIGLTKVADNISKKDDSLLETALLMALGAMGEGNADFYKKVGEYGQEEKTRAASDLVYNQGFLNVYVESGDYAKAIELAEQNGEEAMAEGLRTIDNLLK